MGKEAREKTLEEKADVRMRGMDWNFFMCPIIT